MKKWFSFAGDLPESKMTDNKTEKNTFGLTMSTNSDLGYSENIIAMPATLDEKKLGCLV